MLATEVIGMDSATARLLLLIYIAVLVSLKFFGVM